MRIDLEEDINRFKDKYKKKIIKIIEER